MRMEAQVAQTRTCCSPHGLYLLALLLSQHVKQACEAVAWVQS